MWYGFSKSDEKWGIYVVKEQMSPERSKLHKPLYRLFRALIRRPLLHRFHYSYDKYTPKTVPFLLLTNHNLAQDPALIACSWRSRLYFVADQHALPQTWAARLLHTTFCPLAPAATPEETAAAVCRVLQSGISVGLFAEGERSFSGETGSLAPNLGQLIKQAGVPLITYRTEGGYLTQPRWAKSLRPGGMLGHVINEYAPTLLQNFTPEQINVLVQADLYTSADQEQGLRRRAYRGKNLAEHLENALYLCPECGDLNTLYSQGNRLLCHNCNMELLFTPYGLLEQKNGFPAPHTTVKNWMDWQAQQLILHKKDWQEHPAQIIARDPNQSLYKMEETTPLPLGRGEMVLYGDRLQWMPTQRDCQPPPSAIPFPYREIRQMTLHGADLLRFSLADGSCYQLASDHPRSGLKYLHLLRLLQEDAADNAADPANAADNAAAAADTYLPA